MRARVRRVLRPVGKGLCWACSLNRCADAKKDNTCSCCRNGHVR